MTIRLAMLHAVLDERMVPGRLSYVATAEVDCIVRSLHVLPETTFYLHTLTSPRKSPVLYAGERVVIVLDDGGTPKPLPTAVFLVVEVEELDA